MPRRPVRPLLALAVAGGACLLAASPALAGPKHAAEAALASLDGVPHRAVETSTMQVSLRGAGKLGRQFPRISSRTVAVHAVESSTRDMITFTAAPDALRGVRVVSYEGQVYLSRQGGPYQRATGQLKRFLATAAPAEDERFPIEGAEVLAPVVRDGARLRHLRVRFGAADQLAAARRVLVGQGMPKSLVGKIFGAFRIERSVADIYVDASTGMLAEVTQRFDMTANMGAVSAAIDPTGEKVPGTMVFRGSSTLRVTAVGAVAVEQPAATNTVSSLEYLGMPAVEPAAKGPSGNAEGIALARRVDAAYRSVPAIVRTTRRGSDSQVITSVLGRGRERAVHAVGTSGGKRGEWIGLGAAAFMRQPGASCWTRTDPDTSHQPAINLNGSRFYAPRVSGAVVRLRVLEQIPGADKVWLVYTVDRRTARIVTDTEEGLTTRWRVLSRAPRIQAPAPMCAAA